MLIIKRKLQILILSLVLLFPTNILAYSKNIIVGGENIGISVNSKGIIIVGFYKVNDSYIGKDAGLELGDRIVSVNKKEVSNISNMIDEINHIKDKDIISIGFIRGRKTNSTTLKLVLDNNNIYKTGLYVKDQITGIGTLTFIDPNSKIFGALGHEIVERNTNQRLEVKDGEIFKSEVIDITKSIRGTPGEKNAKFHYETIYGKVFENTMSGLFGYANDILITDKLVKVGEADEVKLGKATITTVIDGVTKRDFDINIIKIDKNSEVKNILFEITDKELLAKTGGVVQGMSGSPILQNNMIIGAVTHVIVNESNKGYAIFITTMLKEGEN
ncbi:MAG: SpoIVB peptidase S55 domain-containing protein [Bacilli bacterium]